ncbi:hypothetical protein ACFO0U_04870 [Chromohalobacter sarecensis]|uniref:Uncharacterized protein n=1 Tax=Chromohalobacter sarecensis TaxID=245294 RepID=A0ABV9CZD5_9GAMM|nr:hypothetical protein [Chromohalobacter sarecensis]MCK0713387.1 hypothetical protein [Chromohalobacter sarecensis]
MRDINSSWLDTISLGDLAKRHDIEPVVGDTMRGIRIAHINRLKNQLSIH